MIQIVAVEQPARGKNVSNTILRFILTRARTLDSGGGTLYNRAITF